MPKTFKGNLFFIVGNSGSGKDSLLKEAMEQWPEDLEEIKVPRRYITRPPHETEPYHSVTEEKFKEMKTMGKFCLDWHIYDLYYGVPVEVENWLENGHLVVINVSRSIIEEAKKKYPDLKIIFVKVPLEITIERIKSRGRESEGDPEYKRRIDRARKKQNLPEADFVVENVGPLEENAQVLKKYLLKFAKNKEKTN